MGRDGGVGLHRVLVVDDDASWRELAVTALEEAGIEADGAESGEAALAALARDHYDGAVVDVHMPGRDGISVVRSIRAEYGNRLALLIATAMPEADGVCRGLLAGADEEHFKLDSPREMVGKLQRAYEAHRSAVA